MEEIKNRVAESGLITIDLEHYFPAEEIVPFDLKDFLFMEMLLKEKEFRASLDAHDWEQYRNKAVAVFCSTDAIIPMWAYMLVSTKLSSVSSMIINGTIDEALRYIFIKNIQQADVKKYEGKRVFLKGCGEKEIPSYAYMEMSNRLISVVASLMYGEPCSTVPVYKKKG
ncbi:MAG: DUF2480 family protein [bacterium]